MHMHKHKESKQATVRLFVAIPIPGQILNPLKHWVDGNKDKLSFRKWVHPDDYHITLQFLGETATAKLTELHSVLNKISVTPFPLILNGVGTFGSSRNPRVLWAGVSGNLDELHVLQRAVTQVTRPLGFIPEERPYTSHITLARGSAGGGEALPIGKLTPPAPEQWTVDRFTLMRTHMNTSPMYEVVEQYPFTSPI